ncbi:conserved hypothetical protein [Beutenbergia cavernae DSM 12333]|uniref:Integral membrane bound transporter domain-containing protein n=1 Tax=Beutenbergia cavernae (strain ATCC BAA-8 / DSM 12333 / CCUG 43141 / JCM 11478 / NBRC 16432 / NCIMB 13614 / HKI 0122) TaxID=471853 RepID=C5C231_BEUC1|nr:FUSC family protein [Beutenbergia cavernae]ACQ81656.1 conserved hypothetical protein [Beutenbergia cavernae DSM 12333]
MPGRLRAWRVAARSRTRQGVVRVRTAFVPVLWASLAAGVAVAIAYVGLGHTYPFFAAIAAWVCLGFSPDVQPRRVGELALGVSLGVGLGELFAHLFGTGPVQIAVVLFLAALVARFLDAGQMFTTQSGVQAIVVVGLPAIAVSSGPVGRWTDALIGGGVALLFSAFLPGDPRTRPRALGREVLLELADVLGALTEGLRLGDAHRIEDALVAARGTQTPIDSWRGAVTSAQQTTRISPAWRRRAGEIAELDRACTLADRAIRNARVLARRAAVAVRDGFDPGPVPAQTHALSVAARELAQAVGSGSDAAAARSALADVAAHLRPEDFEGWRQQSLVILMRSLTTDLLQLTGMPYAQARATFPGGPGDDGAAPPPSSSPAV